MSSYCYCVESLPRHEMSSYCDPQNKMHRNIFGTFANTAVYGFNETFGFLAIQCTFTDTLMGNILIRCGITNPNSSFLNPCGPLSNNFKCTLMLTSGS